MTIISVKLSKKQLALLDAEVKRRRRSELSVTLNTTRSSVIREAIVKLVTHA